MKIITLSDYTREMKSALQRERQAEFNKNSDKYEFDIKNVADRKAKAAVDIAENWRNGNYLVLLWAVFRRIGLFFLIMPSKPSMRDESREESIWKSGNDGEAAVQEHFERDFPNEWVMVNGYKNRGGEIDSLLIGPEGVYAFEIKNINGDIMVDGDKWTRDKYDNYRNIIERGMPIHDKKGRSPSQQINHAADKLEKFLLSRNVSIERVVRSVILSHKKASINQIKNNKVDFIFLQKADVSSMLALSSVKLSEAEINKIIKLVEQDHQFNIQPRRPHGVGYA